MYFSFDLVKAAFDGLVKIDSSDGKSRKEKISGLRYLIAASKIIAQEKRLSINLKVGSNLRKQFLEAVGSVVALNDSGLYTKDFCSEFGTKRDFGVGSNFYTTRLVMSRSKKIRYPGRPAHLLLLEKERISILKNISQTLSQYYGINNVKAELSVWLLRNIELEINEQNIPENRLRSTIKSKLKEIYTEEIVQAILPSGQEVESLTKQVSGDIFTSEKKDYSVFAPALARPDTPREEPFSSVLNNDLSDEDPVLKTTQKLLNRGAKGILFSGPPGTSKTWYALKIAIKIIKGDQSKLERVQFHPSFTYEDFIEGLVSTGSATSNDPMFKPKDKIFLNLCEKARADIDNLYILIIDEFSRGDPSKIFGELLTYIEPDYRDIKFKLPCSEKSISIPRNVVIFATMNPHDKSVVDLDAAMERRFDVIKLSPKVETLKLLLNANSISGEILGKVITFFNAANRLAPHGFGHTYFKGIKNEEDLILLWNHKLRFIFDKMFPFNEDAYQEVRDAFLQIISDDNKELLE